MEMHFKTIALACHNCGRIGLKLEETGRLPAGDCMLGYCDTFIYRCTKCGHRQQITIVIHDVTRPEDRFDRPVLH